MQILNNMKLINTKDANKEQNDSGKEPLTKKSVKEILP